MSTATSVLVGIPPSVGFLGKWYIAVGAVRAGAWPIAVVVFLSTLLTLSYVARLLERLYFAEPTEPTDPAVGAGTDADAGTGADADTELGARDPDPVADGGARADSRAPAAVSTGMVAVIVAAAVVAVALGFATAPFEAFLERFLGGVFP